MGGTWFAVSARVSAVLMLVGGVFCGAASVERWWPECRPGHLVSAGCGRLQDHLYDYIVPSDPWVPVGSAATLAGVGALVMGAGLVLLLPIHAGQREQRVLALVVAALAFATLHDGAATLLSGRAGRPVEVPFLSGLRGPWEILLFLALAVLAFRIRSMGTTGKGWGGLVPLAVSLLVFSVAPLMELVFLPSSHDKPPWSGAISAMSMVVVGWAAWCLPQRSGRQGDREGGVARPA